MADELYGLTKADVDVLRSVVAAWRNGTLIPPDTQTRKAFMPRSHHFVAMASSIGVDAFSGSVAGHADVTLCTVSTSGLVANTTYAVHAYNLSLTAVSADAIIQIKREEKTGRFMIDFENCE